MTLFVVNPLRRTEPPDKTPSRKTWRIKMGFCGGQTRRGFCSTTLLGLASCCLLPHDVVDAQPIHRASRPTPSFTATPPRVPAPSDATRCPRAPLACSHSTSGERSLSRTSVGWSRNLSWRVSAEGVLAPRYRIYTVNLCVTTSHILNKRGVV